MAGDWQPSTQYTLVKADGGLDRTRFDAVTVDREFAFLSATLSYDESSALLTLERNAVPVEEVADSPNEQEVAREVDAASPPVSRAVLVMDAPSAKSALQQLAGDWSASIRSSMLDDSRFVRHAVFDWASTAAEATEVATSALTNSPRPVWGRAFHSSADRSGSQGVRADQRDIAGFVLGLHRKLSRDLTLSGFTGFQNSRLTQPANDRQGASATIQSAHLGAALTGLWKMARLTAGMSHTWHALSSRRMIDLNGRGQLLASDYKAGQTQLFGEMAAPVAAGGTTRVEPFVRLALLASQVKAFSEQGGDAALKVRAAHDRMTFAETGIKVEYAMPGPYGRVRLTGRLGWRHAGGQTMPVARQSFRYGASGGIFRADGLPLARNALQFESGVDAPVARHSRLQLAYAGQYGGRQQDHGVHLGLRIGF